MKVIVSGGTGLVGTEIIKLLLERGDEVINLTTQQNKKSSVKGLTHSYWNPSDKAIDISIFQNAEAIINLAGYNVANRWTKSNMQKMIDSRIQSTSLLVETAKKHAPSLKSMVSTSASGYYQSSLDVQTEESAPGQGFLAQLTIDWEQEAKRLENSNVSLCILRVGVVLDKNDGALAKLLPFFKMGLGSPSGSGAQMMSWIHVKDLARMFVFSIDQQLKGTFNACAPEPVSNKIFSKALAHQLQKPYFLPPIPGFVLNLMFGKMSSMILNSQNLSSKKILNSGFQFLFPKIELAFQDIL